MNALWTDERLMEKLYDRMISLLSSSTLTPAQQVTIAMQVTAAMLCCYARPDAPMDELKAHLNKSLNARIDAMMKDIEGARHYDA